MFKEWVPTITELLDRPVPPIIYIYGHVWMVLGLLATHASWGVIALPLLAKLSIRKKDLPAIHPKHRPTFRTKLEMAAELLEWAAQVL